MRYREYAASPQLAPVVHCVWTLEGHARELADLQPILPDGRPEIILHLGDPFDRIGPAGACERQPATMFAGQLVEPLTLRPTGSIVVVGIRMQPHGAAALLSHPQHDLVGLTTAVDVLSPGLARVLDEARGRADAPAEAVVAIQQRLVRHFDARRIDSHVQAAVDLIQREHGLLTVDGLARRVGLTARHLERRFKHVVGISPKRLARITRFQRALRLLDALDALRRGAHTAAACGYADQAHFIRDFRALAGCPPCAHVMRRAELNGFFGSGGRAELR